MATKTARLGLVIDLDACDGCGACSVACALENNVAIAREDAGPEKGIAPLTVYRVARESADGTDLAFVPIMCQHCAHHTPCVQVCPQNAVDVDPETGIVSQIVDRCLGCRYCMTACPYHARVFNWWTPVWPEAVRTSFAPDVPLRMRGVAEKCNLCHGRLQRAQDSAAAAGRRGIDEDEMIPACAEVCPRGAIHFGDLADPDSRVAALIADPRAFRLLEHLGTDPTTVYLSSREWVRHIDREETFLANSAVSHEIS